MLVQTNIAHIVISLDCGGLEQLVTRWTNLRNADRENSTHIFCIDQEGSIARLVQGDVVHCLQANRGKKPWDQQAVTNLRSLIKKLDIKLLHSHNLTAMQYGALATWNSPVAHINTQHGANLHLRSLKDRLRSKLLSYSSDALVAVSEDTANTMATKQWIPRTSIRVIVNGIQKHQRSASDSVAELRRQFAVDSTLIIGFVGRLNSVKGLDLFLPVFEKLVHDRGEKLALLLVGDGPERDNIVALAGQLNITNNIIFTGEVLNPAIYYDIMDIFLLPSRSEGLSVSLLEAMASALPVIVTDVGENRTVTEGGQTGLLLSNNSIEWEGPIANLLHDRARLKQMGLEAQKRVHENYSIESTLMAYESLYVKISKHPHFRD